MTRPTQVAIRIAEHLSIDSAEMEDGHRYQPTRWTRPVYSIGEAYWSAGPKPPRHIYGGSHDFDGWERVISDFDRKSVLWRTGE